MASYGEFERVDIALSIEDRRMFAHWAADCAERVLSLFEAKAPNDSRPRAAIAGARAFVRDGKRTARLRSARWAAFAAAREVDDPVATAAARAADLAAAGPYTHALATSRQSGQLLGPGAYQAQAREMASGNDPGVGDEEICWAIEHASPTVHDVVRRFPPRAPGCDRLDTLYYQLDLGLRC